MWSWNFAKVAGIDLKVHVSFLLVLLLGAFQWGDMGARGALFGVVLTLLVFASVTLHELGHSLVAKAFGVPVKDITLYPIGGVARLGARPKKAAHELLIALAGPAVNVVLAVGLALFGGWAFADGKLVEALTHASVAPPSTATLVAMLMTSNAFLAIFNMVPALPMDGGRVLRALLTGWLGAERATSVAAKIARVVAVLLFAAGIALGSPMLPLIAMFVFFGAGQEERQQKLGQVLERVSLANVLNPYAPRFSVSTTLHEALQVVTMTHWNAFAVEHFDRLVGIVSRKAIMDAIRSEGPWGYVAGVMDRDPPTLDSSATLEQARESMSQTSRGYVVVARDGQPLGVFTEVDLAMVASQLAQRPTGPKRGSGNAASAYEE